MLHNDFVRSSEPEVLAVAAHDIGQYVTNCTTRGKSNVERLRGKERIMALLGHENKEVQYQVRIASVAWSPIDSIGRSDLA